MPVRSPGKRRAFGVRADLFCMAENVQSVGTRPIAVQDATSGRPLVCAGRCDGAEQLPPRFGSCGRTLRQNGRACGNFGRADAGREGERGSLRQALGKGALINNDVMEAERTSCLCDGERLSAGRGGLRLRRAKKSARSEVQGAPREEVSVAGLRRRGGGDGALIRRWRTCACVPRGRCLRQEFPRPRACGTPRRS